MDFGWVWISNEQVQKIINNHNGEAFAIIRLNGKAYEANAIVEDNKIFIDLNDSQLPLDIE